MRPILKSRGEVSALLVDLAGQFEFIGYYPYAVLPQIEFIACCDEALSLMRDLTIAPSRQFFETSGNQLALQLQVARDRCWAGNLPLV